jgi:uncharacterized protein YbaA (DUF1428 family)
MLGCADDDLKILLAKNFLIPFETGVCVIKHWKLHNYIQKDRYKPTVYVDEKNKLSTKNNDVYTLDTGCIHDVYSMDTQVSIGKVSLGKDIKNYSSDFLLFWTNYPKKTGKDAAYKLWEKLNPRIDDVMFALSWQKESQKWQDGFIPNPATYLNQGRWKDEPDVELEGSPF